MGSHRWSELGAKISEQTIQSIRRAQQAAESANPNTQINRRFATEIFAPCRALPDTPEAHVIRIRDFSKLIGIKPEIVEELINRATSSIKRIPSEVFNTCELKLVIRPELVKANPGLAEGYESLRTTFSKIGFAGIAEKLKEFDKQLGTTIEIKAPKTLKETVYGFYEFLRK